MKVVKAMGFIIVSFYMASFRVLFIFAYGGKYAIYRVILGII
jgi:hypothetical protein